MNNETARLMNNYGSFVKTKLVFERNLTILFFRFVVFINKSQVILNPVNLYDYAKHTEFLGCNVENIMHLRLKNFFCKKVLTNSTTYGIIAFVD